MESRQEQVGLPVAAPEDPRMGLPSASSAREDYLCPGRYRAQQEWGVADDSSAAEAGTRMHKLYAGDQSIEATSFERNRVEYARVIDEAMQRKWRDWLEESGRVKDASGLHICDPTYHFRWKWNVGGQMMFSGETDRVVIAEELRPEFRTHVLLTDFKSLFGEHDPADINFQIRRYVGLMGLETPSVMTVTAYINQPSMKGLPAATLFERGHIVQAMEELRVSVLKMLHPKAPRIPGNIQCTHCKAKLSCPEYQKVMKTTDVLVRGDNGEPATTAQMAGRLTVISNEHLEKILPWVQALESFRGLAWKEAKERLKAKKDAFGYRWFLEPNDRDEITDLSLVLANLTDGLKGLTVKEFLGACSLSKEKLANLIRSHTNLKGKGLNDAVQEACAGAIKTKELEPTLKKAPAIDLDKPLPKTKTLKAKA